MVEQQDINKSIIEYVNANFYGEYLEGLKGKLLPFNMISEFVRIPSLSPIFDDQWQENRNLFKQMYHLVAFAEKVGVRGMKILPKEDPGRTPFLIVDVEA